MEFIAQLPLIGGFLATALPFILVLGIVVFVHEYGHYIVGRWCGIHADTFSMGFGPVLTSWVDRRGTTWQVAALPLGGFVKFKGDADGSSRADPDAMAAMSPEDQASSFHGASVWRRIATVAAGPLANFLLAAVVFTGLATWEGKPVTPLTLAEVDAAPGMDMGVRPGDQILKANGEAIDNLGDLSAIARGMETPEPMMLEILRDGRLMEIEALYPFTTRVLGVDPFKPAGKAGLKSGDFIIAANGVAMRGFDDLIDVVTEADLSDITLTVLRDGETIDVTLRPEMSDNQRADGTFEKKPLIGVSGGIAYTEMTETPPIWEAAWIGVRAVIFTIERLFQGIVALVQGIIGLNNLQGPLGIAQTAGHVAQEGTLQFINLIAVISTAIGMINLFPIPVLDGGHLSFFAYEAATGKQPADRFLQIAMSFGLAMVLLLMLFATYNDLVRMLV